VECPELFDGNVQAEWKGDSAGFTGYAATVGNPKNAQPGTYMCLVSKEAQENDPAGKPWLDLTAYQVVTLDVKAHVDQPPTAVVEASQASTYIDELIKFDGSKSHDNDCDGEAIVEWHWDWENDGVFEDEGAVVSHSWSEVGTYSVVLKVVDDEGSEAVLDPPLQIDVAELLKPPIAMADCETFPVWVTKPVHFQDMGSFDPDGGSIVKYEWDWENDGVFDEEGSDVYHTWDTPGIYYVEFRVTDDESETGVLSIPIEVEVKALAVPVAAASVYPNPGFVNQPIHFYNTDSYDPDSGDVVLYEWDWENDGVFDAVGIEAFNSWGAPGTYYVQLRVTDDDGQTGVLSQPLEVTIFESNPLNIQDLTPPSLNFSPKDLAIDGNYAYVAASGNGLHIFDITNPANPVWVNRVETGNGVIYDDTAGDDATAVAVENGYAYVADWRSGLTIVDVDPPQSATILKNVAVPGWCARAVTLYAGYAFVLCDSYPANQLVIVDVDPPEEAHVVQTVYAPGAENVVIEGGYAYTDGNAILKIDINPAEDAHVLNEIPLGGHGVAVSNGYAYTAEYHATPEYTWYTLAVIDIDPPESAYIVKELDGDHPNDLGISGNHLFLSSTWSFKAYDISSPESTQEIDSYEDQMSRFGGFDIQGENAFVANGVQGVQVLSIEPMNDISLKTTVFTPGAGRDVCVAGGYALVANYSSGLQIYDVDPPSSAAFVNAVQEFVYARRIASDDGYAFLTDMNNILAYDVDPPSSAYDANQIDVEPDRWPIAATNGYAYVGADSEGLKIIDVDPIDSAHLESTVTMNHAKGVVVDGSFAYVANGHDGLSIVDIGTVGSEYVIKTVLTSGVAGLVAVANGYAYVGDVFLYPGGPAVDVIDIDPIESAYIVKTIGLAEQPADLAVSNGYVFVADGYQGMVVVDTTVPESAYVLTECGTPWPVGSIDIVDNVAYLSGASIGDSGVLMYQLW
jgi:hypothetical protein